MNKNIVNKSVSFNISDPFQRQMKQYVEQYPNFSGYIKRLIQRDMEGGIAKKAPSNTVINRNSMAALNGFVMES
jgi:hypothetical protein